MNHYDQGRTSSSLEGEVAEQILMRFKGGYVSRRDGLHIVKVEIGGRTVVVWIRKTPITRKALNLFWKYVGKHEYDELVILKLTTAADAVKFEELKKFKVIKSIEELL